MSIKIQNAAIGRLRIACAALLLAVGGTIASAQEPMTLDHYIHHTSDYELVNQAYNQCSATLISPHVQWARNPAWGEPRLLIVMPTWTSREAVELKERFPSQVSIVMTRSHIEWSMPPEIQRKGEWNYHSADPKEVDRIALTLLNRPDKYDAIIIGKVSWKAIPETVRQLIMDRVATGCGLVYVGPSGLDERLAKLCESKASRGDAPRIAEGVPLAEFPVWNGKRRMVPGDISAAQYGQGRVVFVNYPDSGAMFQGPLIYEDKTAMTSDPAGNARRMTIAPETIGLTPYAEDDPLFYEYYHSLLGKAILWASRKEPEVRLAPKSETIETDIAALPASLPLFQISGGKPTASCKAYMELRDRNNKVLFGRTVAIKAVESGEEVALELPRVKTGLYMADLWLSRGGRVVNWASVPINVAGSQYIDAVVPDKEAFAKGEAISGKVRLKADLPTGAWLRVELGDTHQRIAGRADLAASGREAAFAVELKHPLSRVYAVSAAVMDSRGTLEERTTHVGVPDSSIRDFISVMWANAISNRTYNVMHEQCRRFDVDCYYDQCLYLSEEAARKRAFVLASNNLTVETYAQHINAGGWYATMAELLHDHVDALLGRAKAYAPYGVLGHSICEENDITKTDDKWGQPKAMDEYRQWAKSQFGSLEKANRAWSTSFKKWSDLGLIGLAEAKRRDCFALWVSQQRYRQDVFMRIHEAAAAKLREGDPGVRVTLDCIGGYDFDWPRTAEFIQGGYAAGPLTPFVAYRPKPFFGEGVGCNPGQLDPFRMKYYTWKGLFDGGNLTFWWPVGLMDGLGGPSAFTADLSEPLLCFSQWCEEVKKAHRGVGALLVQSQKVRDPIVMNHSTMSYYASVLNRKDITWEDSQNMFHDALMRIGRTARELTPREMENLRYGDGARVLILPYSQSMTEKEIAAVEQFAEDGGLVVADFAPALFDEHCLPYGKPQVVNEGKETVCPKCGGKMRYEEATATVTRWIPCPVCAGTGKIMEGREVRFTGSKLEQFFGGFTPMHMETHGKGKSLYLGKTLGNPGDWEGFARLLEQYAGLKRQFSVLDNCGNPRTDVLTASFVNGTSRFFCFLPERLVADPPGPETTVTLPEKRHVYDVLRQEYLGYSASFKSGAVPAVPKIFAALPCKLDSLSLSGSGKKFEPGDEVKINATLTPAEVAGAGLCVRFEVLGPAGKPLDCYTRKVVSTTGQFEMVLPLAINEAPGRYTVVAEEIVSGLRAEAPFDVRGPISR